ncbi:TPA: hypothetical protein MYP81_000119 [Citrobacter farmeri]|uniref:hypothetical protein n=1 Tax=Citrobacter farmeri TaxID=67824 RepID=UPI001A200EB4|nr:hypothetical protein [Citrobacter farmeri]MBU5644080.1 hypothetical protein [Pluralibacter sp. S54_ASV_43]HAT3756927.1 hypothetical protein [Citrobacter amalonaticus]HAU5706216.1 hypothetical protein [Citrobacter freundii]QZE47618.1 hypothetical protein Cf24236_2872 [Citrobacter farmeri]HCB1594034.1 hypothetical protein [Citrobacter farmeri]
MLNDILFGVSKQVLLRLVYIVSYDLNGAQNEYAAINKSLEDAGYSRNSSAGEKTIPKNIFAGEKDCSYNSNDMNEKDFINSESLKFRDEVHAILDKEAPGKFDKIFVSVSNKDATSIRLK